MSDQAFTKLHKFVFRIRQRYFDAIVAGTKTVEYRKDTKFWQVRIFHAVPCLGEVQVYDSRMLFSTPGDWNLAIAVFICGKRKHQRWIRKIKRMPTPPYFSEQGKKDVNTPTCLGFQLGEVLTVVPNQNAGVS
jgi:hypothetical protein